MQLVKIMMKNVSLLGILFTLGAAFLWGTAGTAQSLAQGGTSPYWIGAFRLLIAAIFFHLLFWLKRPVTPARTKSATTIYGISIVTAGICIGLYNLAFFAGIQATGIAIGTVTTIGSAPIWAGLMQMLILRKMPRLLWWLGTSCAILGGACMVLSQADAWQINIWGLVICLCAGFCYALYSLMSKRVVNLAPSVVITKHIFTIALIVALPIAALLAGKPTLTSTSVMVILYLGIFTTGIAYLLYTFALKYISAATGVALALAEPIVAFVLALTIAGESVTPLAIVGLGLILLGLWFVLRSENSDS